MFFLEMTEERICPICGKHFIVNKHHRKTTCCYEHGRILFKQTLKDKYAYKTEEIGVRYCKHCGKVLEKRPTDSWWSFRRRVTCGIKCSHGMAKKDYHYNCPECGKDVVRKQNYKRQICCSDKCRRKHKKKLYPRPTITKICEHCGKEFIAYVSLEKANPKKYCNRSCYEKHEPPKTCRMCGDTFYSKAHNAEVCYPCKIEYGDRHLNNLCNSLMDKFRKDVYAKDDHKCQICFTNKKRLEAHHIFPFLTYIDLRYDITNGITLCRDHHVEVHRLYRQGKLTPEDLWSWVLEKRKEYNVA